MLESWYHDQIKSDNIFFALLSSVFIGITFIAEELKFQSLGSSDTKAEAYVL